MKPENEAKALEVGRLLGFTKDTESNNWQVLFRMPDRGAMTITDSKQRGKLVVDMWPAHELVEHRRTYYGSGEERPRTEIGVAETKPAETIAADILRRLLPEYEKLVADCRERKAAADDYEARRENALKELAAAFGIRLEREEHNNRAKRLYWNCGGQYALIEASSGEVRFESFHVPQACAVEIAGVMAKHFNAVKQEKGE